MKQADDPLRQAAPAALVLRAAAVLAARRVTEDPGRIDVADLAQELVGHLGLALEVGHPRLGGRAGDHAEDMGVGHVRLRAGARQPALVGLRHG